MHDFRGGEVLSNQQAQDVALGGPTLILVITGTLSLIQHSHGFSLSFPCLVHLPSQLPFPIFWSSKRNSQHLFYFRRNLFHMCLIHWRL